MAANDVPLQVDDGTRHSNVDVLSYASSTLSLKAGKHLGLSSTSNFGAFGTAPIAQPAGAGQAAISAITGIGVCDGTPAAALTSVAGGADQTKLVNDLASMQRDIAALHTLLSSIRTALVNLGIIKGSA